LTVQAMPGCMRLHWTATESMAVTSIKSGRVHDLAQADSEVSWRVLVQHKGVALWKPGK